MLPDKKGYFDGFGGKFVPETLMTAIDELERSYRAVSKSASFKKELGYYLKEYAGRPTGLYFAKRLTGKLGGAKIYLKREDLLHTGAHKINNTIGQALLAIRMGKKRVIAETGAGQHGVATATVAALFGLECEIFMGDEDIRRQAVNVFKMKILGAKVTPVHSGSKTLKDAMNEAMRDWVTIVRDTYYVIGSVAGPHPYPMMVRDFQSVIGKETRRQVIQKTGRLPDYIVACVGGGSNAMGLFYEFIGDDVKMTGVEAGGKGIASGEHAARFAGGSVGIFQGCKSYLLQDEDGNVLGTHSVSAGLDYASIGPEHPFLRDSGRVQYTYATDQEALSAFELLSNFEGIIPALESAHAVAEAAKLAPSLSRDRIIIVNLSGRGDKDVQEVARIKGIEL